MTEQIVNLRTEQLNDGRKAVVADITGGARILFGYTGDDVKLAIGGGEKSAKKLIQ